MYHMADFFKQKKLSTVIQKITKQKITKRMDVSILFCILALLTSTLGHPKKIPKTLHQTIGQQVYVLPVS